METNNKNYLNVMVVDDHPVFRKGVMSLLAKFPLINAIHEAENGLQAIELCRLNNIDFIFLDINMPILNGEEVAKILKKELPEIKIVILSMLDNKHQIVELLKLGVNGFILKSTDEEEMKKAIDLILDGNQYLTPEVKEKWIEYLLNLNNIKTDLIKPLFTDREIEIMKLLADQLTTKEISDKLFIAESTINTHKKHLMSKIGTDNSIGIVMFAIRNEYYIP